jgi:hypothetical protein
MSRRPARCSRCQGRQNSRLTQMGQATVPLRERGLTGAPSVPVGHHCSPAPTMGVPQSGGILPQGQTAPQESGRPLESSPAPGCNPARTVKPRRSRPVPLVTISATSRSAIPGRPVAAAGLEGAVVVPAPPGPVSRPAVSRFRLAQLPRPRSNRRELRAESPSPCAFAARVRERRSVAPKPNVPEWASP